MANVRIASLFNSSTSVAASSATFESNLSDNERVLAFNLNASTSQQMQGDQLTAVGTNRTHTYWTSTATSFVFGTYGAFAESKLLVAAHLWKLGTPASKGVAAVPSSYQLPMAYSKGANGNYSVSKVAEPGGLAAEAYLFYIASLGEDLEKICDKMDALIKEDLLNSPEMAELEAEKAVIEADMKSMENFYGLCENTQVKFNIPNLTKEEMKRVWSCLNRKESQILKLKCTINYDFSDTLEILIQVLDYSIEEGRLATPTKGRQVGNALGGQLQDAAKQLWAERQMSTAEIIAQSRAKRAAFEATAAGEGKVANKRRQDLKKMADLMKQQQEETKLEAKTATTSSIPEVDKLEDVEFDDEIDATY